MSKLLKISNNLYMDLDYYYFRKFIRIDRIVDMSDKTAKSIANLMDNNNEFFQFVKRNWRFRKVINLYNQFNLYKRIIKTHKCVNSAWSKGYITLKNVIPLIEKYSGKYGEGYKLHYSTSGSTRYHKVDYYVK